MPLNQKDSRGFNPTVLIEKDVGYGVLIQVLGSYVRDIPFLGNVQTIHIL